MKIVCDFDGETTTVMIKITGSPLIMISNVPQNNKFFLFKLTERRRHLGAAREAMKPRIQTVSRSAFQARWVQKLLIFNRFLAQYLQLSKRVQNLGWVSFSLFQATKLQEFKINGLSLNERSSTNYKMCAGSLLSEVWRTLHELCPSSGQVFILSNKKIVSEQNP